MQEHVEYHSHGKKRIKDMLPCGMATGIQRMVHTIVLTITIFESAY
jgi:hypothetical protein